MASPAPPDAKTLTNWEEAFEHYSIPQVRTLHKQLQYDLGVNRERLRALVGWDIDILFEKLRIFEDRYKLIRMFA